MNFESKKILLESGSIRLIVDVKKKKCLSALHITLKIFLDTHFG
jgi:hypothetical protein